MYHHEITPAKQERFLDVLAETGNVLETCRILNLNRSSMYHRKAGDPEFAARWDFALQMNVDHLREVVIRKVTDLMPEVVRVPLRDRNGDVVLNDDFEPVMVPMPAGGDMDLLRSVASRAVFAENKQTNVQVNTSTTVQTPLPAKPNLVWPEGAIRRSVVAETGSDKRHDTIDAEVVQGTPQETRKISDD